MGDEDFKPSVFGNYYLLEHIAYGGMAEIYRAKSFGASGFERELVLKRVLKKLTDNPDFLNMLVNEAKLTATLQHGHIAQVFELGLIDGSYFITMEYVEGVSLKQFLRSLAKKGESLTLQEACYITAMICFGLDYAHRKTDPMGNALGIVHCDVTPDNVIMGFDGTAKVVDFGIARAQASFSNYKEGMVMGKFNYVAPEQAMGKDMDCRADIFSTGIILYELLTGTHPFGRKGDVDTLIRIARFEKGEVKEPHLVRPDIPPALSAIVMKALANNRDERYPSARHLADALMGFIHPLTGAQVHQRIQDRIHVLYADRIAKRRATRGQDPEIIRQLQRQVAAQHAAETGSQGATQATPGAGTPTPVAPAPKGGAAKFIWPAVGLALGVGAAFGIAPMMAPVGPSYLFVDSQPRGAKVLLERAPKGETPLVLEVEAGHPYLLSVEKKGHASAEETLSTDEPGLLTRSFELEALEVGVELLSEPEGAEVKVNGVSRGRTPVTVKLAVGSTAKIEATLKGRTESRDLEVPETETALRFKFPTGRRR